MFRQFLKALERLEPLRISWARSPIGCSSGASSSGKMGSTISTNLGTPGSAQQGTPGSAKEEPTASAKEETTASAKEKTIASAKEETIASSKEETLTSEKEATSTAFDRNRITKEQKLTQILKKSLPGITYVSIQDISGGCGAMFEINIEAKEFNGLTRLKQHRLVTDSLKKEIPEMHGIRINTNSPPPAPPTLSK